MPNIAVVWKLESLEQKVCCFSDKRMVHTQLTPIYYQLDTQQNLSQDTIFFMKMYLKI